MIDEWFEKAKDRLGVGWTCEHNLEFAPIMDRLIAMNDSEIIYQEVDCYVRDKVGVLMAR